MKKLLLLLVILVAAAGAVAYFKAGSIVKVGVETAGPETLKVPVRVENINLSPFTGKVTVKGLEVGQPEGFGEGVLASVGNFDMKVRPASLFSDHIIIDHIVIDAPMLDARRIDGKSNFEKLQQNVGTSGTEDTGASDITLTIKSIQVRAPKVTVKNEGGMMDVDQTVELADFTITDLGTDEKGLAPAEIARHVMAVLQPQIAQALIKAGASDKIKDLAKGAEGKLEQGISSLVGKFKKKTGDTQNDDNN
ncbi:MAG: hypothetical protein HWE25_15045 [Alphaproteobacteria bacterium]|nr:hypothetical protein [Alphaproteobacteria bacterium]